MREEKIDVTAYSGYRGEEGPKAFIHQGRNITVVEILKGWIQEEAGKRRRRRFFEVKGNDDRIHRIVYDEESFEWFYVRGD